MIPEEGSEWIKPRLLTEMLGMTEAGVVTGVYSHLYHKGKGFKRQEVIDFINRVEDVKEKREQQRYFLKDHRLMAAYGRYLVKKGIFSNPGSYSNIVGATAKGMPRDSVDLWERANRAFPSFIEQEGLEEEVKTWEEEYNVHLS